jgi:hypothetical protein
MQGKNYNCGHVATKNAFATGTHRKAQGRVLTAESAEDAEKKARWFHYVQDIEMTEEEELDRITTAIIRAAINVHRTLGL